MAWTLIPIAQDGVSAAISLEASFFFHAILTGGLLLVLYDLLRIGRRVWKHTTLWVNIEDFVYWIVSSIIIFAVLFKENNGIIRWFFVLGMFFGMIFYHMTASRYFVDFSSFMLKKVLHLVSVLLEIVLKPIKLLVTFLAKSIGKMRKCAQEIIKKEKKNVESYIKKRYNGIKCPRGHHEKNDRSISREQHTRKTKKKRE